MYNSWNKFTYDNNDKNGLTEYSFSNKSLDTRSITWNQDYRQFVSIDPGEKNIAMRIEKKYFDGRTEPIVYIKENINIDNKGSGMCSVFENLYKFLDQYYPYYLESHFFIIEKQLKCNKETIIEIAQSIIMYFIIKLRDSILVPHIIKMDAKIKYHKMHPKGANHELISKKLKAWGVEEAKRLFIESGDTDSLKILDTHSKKDDLADVKLQIEAFCKIKGLIFNSTKNQTLNINIDLSSLSLNSIQF